MFLKGGGALDITSVRKKPKVGEGYTGPLSAHDCPDPRYFLDDLAQRVLQRRSMPRHGGSEQSGWVARHEAPLLDVSIPRRSAVNMIVPLHSTL